jgi:hypothetical protein
MTAVGEEECGCEGEWRKRKRKWLQRRPRTDKDWHRATGGGGVIAVVGAEHVH